MKKNKKKKIRVSVGFDPTTSTNADYVATTAPSDRFKKLEICLYNLYYMITFYYIRAVRAVRAVQIRHVYYRKYVNYTSAMRVM